MNDRVKRVVGLKYEHGEGLPKVILKASGKLYDKVLEKRNALVNLPVVEDAKLLDELYKLPVEGEIGPELFELVAILLVHVYAIDEKLKVVAK